MTQSTGTCAKHVWERRLEIRNHLERVVRVCAYCGCEEICWSKAPARRKLRPRRSSLAMLEQSAPSRFGPEVAI
jgi:hypothetical protein